MKTIKKMAKMPPAIKIFWAVSFISGVEFMGVFLRTFFREWGGLNQTMVQSLQSFFAWAIFMLEVPTGLIGDVKGKKFSTIVGLLFGAVAVLVYSFVPNLILFFVAELLFALSVAFISGAQEAWFKQTSKRHGISKDFGWMMMISSNLHMTGMLIASFLSSMVIEIFPVNVLFRSGAITNVICALLLWKYVPGVRAQDSSSKSSLKPSYKKVFKKAWMHIKGDKRLQRLIAYVVFLSSIGYFVIWLNQEILFKLGYSNSTYGNVRIVLLIAEIVLFSVAVNLKQKNIKLEKWIPLLVGIGAVMPIVSPSLWGVYLYMILAGGIGLQVRKILAQEINENLPEDSHATILSFVSMIRMIALTLLNPVVGMLVDVDLLYVVLALLGGLAILAFIYADWRKEK